MHCGGHPNAGPWFRLLDRDRRLLYLLHEHKVLTTDQIAALEFTSTRRAQGRLRKLREMGMLFAFRESLYGGGTSQTRHALGYSGARLIAAARAEKPPTPAAHALMLERLACSPTLEHRLGVNGFFAALAAYRNPARHPDTADVEGLTQWWSERQCADQFWTSPLDPTPIRPDGYGCWEEDGRTVRFFLEYDTGTETLSTVAAKLADYQSFPTDRFGILLFSLHSTRRETGLHTALRRTFAISDSGLVIATTARDLTHPDGPAGPVWALLTASNSDTATERLRLAELPERGPRISHHTSTGQPYNEAAFDHDDPTVRDRFLTNQPQPTSPYPAAAVHLHDETASTDDNIIIDLDHYDDES
ncbi:replication-relaxation family protein [Nocardia inohanensis]|uniref:replication-relaxation family protein n=1 Tax=Nocardia inohanensis TaxID=209246 RepID=UPI0009FD26AF|nr:replication-relaxation family protein [Nocardia inohanensis]